MSQNSEAAEAGAAALAKGVAELAGMPGELVVILRVSTEADGHLHYMWEWYWRPREVITEPEPGGHD